MIGGVNMNMKKRVVLLLSFFSFFMFMSEINAQEVTADISIGETRSNDQFNFTSCSASKNGYLTTTITSSGGLKIGTSNTANPGTSDSVTCQYTEKSNIGAPETGEITFKLNIIGKREVRINLGMTSSSYEPSKDIAKEFLPSGSTITGYEVDPNGAEFINVGNCSGTTCNVSISQEAQNIAADGSSLSSIMYITYKIPGSNAEVKINAYLIINAVSGARAYAGGSGVCDFNSSDWRYRTWTDAGGSVYKFYQSYSDSATLPNCDSSKSKIPIEFKGWRETSDNDHVMAIGECSGALPAGSSVEDGKNYSACYERTPYVQISPATGNVDMTTGWTALKGNSGYYYASDSATTVTLPELKFVGIHENDELDYWYNSANPSEHKQSGDTVELDGSIWIAVVKTTVSEGWKDLYKTVKVDQTVALVVDGITGCSSSSGKVSVNFIGGECQVSGVEATGDGEYADVITTVNGEEVIYKFNVEKVDASNVIIDDTIKTNLGTNSEVTNKESWYQEMCSSFTIEGHGSFTNYTSDGSIRGTVYNVSEACGQSGNQGYYAFCLDPGRRSPTNTSYIRTPDIDPSNPNDPMVKLVNVFISKYNNFSMLNSLTDSTRIAFHIALRSVGIASGVTSALDSSDKVYYNAYRWYEQIADVIKTGDANAVASHVAGLGLVSDVSSKLTDLLTDYLNADEVEVEEFERTVTSTETVSYGDAGYKITYKGLIIAPSSVTSVDSLTNDACPSIGLTSCTAELSENTDEATLLQYNGRKVYNYTITIIAEDAGAVNPPDNDEEKKDTAFKVNYTGRYASADVAIAAPAVGDSLQRMFVFNVEQSDVLVYFSVVPTSCEMPSLDYKAHCNAEGCDSEFNADLFMAAGCCRLVTDEVNYKYIIDNYCSGDGCTVSTMSSVCGLNSDNLGSAELYEIREGAKWENGGYVDQIGTCVVNVTQDYSVENLENFQKKDSAGNTLNVSNYSNNKYCQVSCGEDWKISLESFGNFVGENAVAAGTYFSTTNSDLFISGSRTCYTTYIDYDKYMRDLVEQSKIAIDAYNKYSEASHIWTDTDKQNKDDVATQASGRVCVVAKECSDVDSGWDSCTYNAGSDPTFTLEREVPRTCDEDETGPCTETETKTVNACEHYGYYFEKYEIFAHNSGEVETTYDKYTSSNTTTSNTVSSTPTSYDNAEQIVCEYHNPPEGGDATLTCNFTGYASDSAGSKTICQNPSPDNDSFCKDTSADKEEAYNQIKETVQEKAQGIMDENGSIAAGAVNLIHSYSQQMYNCQHFELYNTSDDDKEDANGVEYKNNEISKGSYLDHANVSYVKIDTQFNPHVTYEYDEPEFMTILGPDNILVEYTKKNDEVWGGTYASATDESKDSQVNAYHSRNNSIPVDSSEVKLSRNDISTYYYNTSGKFTGDDVNTYGGDSGSETAQPEIRDLVFCNIDSAAETYSPSYSKYEWDDSGSCYELDIEFIKAHYIKSSISNSSFYKNKGYWYLNASDLKEHGDNVEDALNKANKRDGVNYNVNEEIQNNRWYPYGTDNREEGVNIFPVSLDTPRNLYLYSYEFGDIGSYMDGKLGRLMGDEDSLISLNTRTCFYEVYEELCLCCGSTINSYVENYDTVNDYIQTHPDITYTPSDSNSMNINENGVISFATSSVNLGDLNSDSERMLGNNWGDSLFLYSGNLYETSKGGELLTAIQSQGENVYSETPEYSYYLTPSTISAIRDYNDQYGYEVNYNNLRVYGSYAIRSLCDNDSTSDDCWEVNSRNDDGNEYISFQHYGSSFLEDYMPELGAAYAGTLTENDINGSCFVTAGEANDYEKIKEKVNSGCRWVDYVQETDGKFFRLAFK